jgi:hypothetical protein
MTFSFLSSSTCCKSISLICFPSSIQCSVSFLVNDDCLSNQRDRNTHQELCFSSVVNDLLLVHKPLFCSLKGPKYQVVHLGLRFAHAFFLSHNGTLPTQVDERKELVSSFSFQSGARCCSLPALG